MHTATERRHYERSDVNVPISFSDRDSHYYHRATLFDFSKEGMRIKTEIPMSPESKISIRVGASIPHILNGLNPDDNFQAKVVWCKKNLNKKDMDYTSGVSLEKSFVESSYDMGNVKNLAEMIRYRCNTDSVNIAFLEKKHKKWQPVSWGDVNKKVEKIAAGLIYLGLKTGDKVSILGNTRLEWTLCDLAVLRAACTSVGIYPTLSGEQISYILKDSASKVLFIENEKQIEKLEPYFGGLPELETIITWDESSEISNVINLRSLILEGDNILDNTPEIVKKREETILPTDIANIIYTSGTTGPPKGACLTHANILAELHSLTELIDENDFGEIMMFFLPLSHVGERIAGQYQRINLGITAAYVEDMNHILDDIQEIKPTFFGSVPRIFEKAYSRIMSEVENSSPIKQKIFKWAENIGYESSKIIQANLPLPFFLDLKYKIADKLVFKKIRGLFGGRVNYFLSSAAPISKEIIEFFHAAGLLILEGYGQTEATCFCSLSTPDNYRFGSVGKAIPGIQIKIAHDGEVMVKGKTVFDGYLNQPSLTRKTITEDGWLHTGDIGKLDKDGYLWIIGRKKEIIITSGGKNITPSNIEHMLMQTPLIEQALVHGDRRKFLTCLITLSPDQLETWGKKHGFINLDHDALCKKEALKKEIQKAVDNLNIRLGRYETIKNYRILSKPFLVETGELTPTLKIRRHQIEKKYKKILDSMYE